MASNLFRGGPGPQNTASAFCLESQKNRCFVVFVGFRFGFLTKNPRSKGVITLKTRVTLTWTRSPMFFLFNQSQIRASGNLFASCLFLRLLGCSDQVSKWSAALHGGSISGYSPGDQLFKPCFVRPIWMCPSSPNGVAPLEGGWRVFLVASKGHRRGIHIHQRILSSNSCSRMAFVGSLPKSQEWFQANKLSKNTLNMDQCIRQK